MLPEIQTRLERCPSLPTIPAIAVQVLQLCQKERLNLADIAKVLSTDPALATKVLKMANSPVMGLRSPAKTVSHALSLLGVNTVRTLALSFSLVQDHRSKGKTTTQQRYWKRSLLSALAAQQLAKALHVAHAEEAFLAGLLQDIGILALAQAMPETYPSLVLKADGDHGRLIELERIQIGCDHADVGRWLLARWKMPTILVDVVGSSHTSGTNLSDPDVRQLAKVVALSGWLADIWISEDAAAATAKAQVRASVLLGLQDGALEAVLREIATAMLGDVAKLLEVDTGTPHEVNAILEEAKETLLMASLRAEQEAEQVRESNTLLEEQHRALQEESERDKLTKLYNRARFDSCMAHQFGRTLRGGKPLSLLFCDVDHFKRVNDTWGHPAGDQVLITVAQLLSLRLRQNDLAVRYGGEEFVLILPETDKAGALIVAERVRKNVENALVACSGGPIGVTISIGCATARVDGPYRSAADLVGAADRALYAAKAAGRNRVVDAELSCPAPDAAPMALAAVR